MKETGSFPGLDVHVPAVSGIVTVRVTAQLPEGHFWEIAPGVLVKAVAAEGHTAKLPQDARITLLQEFAAVDSSEDPASSWRVAGFCTRAELPAVAGAAIIAAYTSAVLRFQETGPIRAALVDVEDAAEALGLAGDVQPGQSRRFGCSRNRVPSPPSLSLVRNEDVSGD